MTAISRKWLFCRGEGRRNRRLPSFGMGPSDAVRDPSARPSGEMPHPVQEAVERTLHVGQLKSRGSVPVVKKPEEGKTDAHVNSLDGLA
eukprot:Cvel_28505.t1-p1 / transcript=Cvel_28505.t1 / gene=Cvel_28505 / organism=Chromera_velia_CCMP2878 / gene_product=hypothetical protein / transcript_product=hypothetical protein / location=Cvel_scaffold3745:1-795(-) / protein_length=88 / sequence_SO=supercontig / SO=protein_coding / is_pseudo=false